MKVAVVGGGIFGTTAAIHAARNGHEVHLFEKLDDILKAASSINQYRLHRGYHYPRSPETALASIKGERSFISEYEKAVMRDGLHYYAIARTGSLVSPEEFITFCNSVDLPYEEVSTPLLNEEHVAITIKAEEFWFDPEILKEMVRTNLQESGVTVHLGTAADARVLEDFEKVILATYAGLNTVVEQETLQEYQFELCEKPVVQLPTYFGLTGIVIMDGPFMSVDPFGATGLFVLGNVEHAIHATNIGFTPTIPKEFTELLNSGIVHNPPISKFETFKEHGVQFIPALGDAIHIGSMFTVRTVLPKREKTDARPTLVTAIDDKFIRIFSGKIGNCVMAAEQAVRLL